MVLTGLGGTLIVVVRSEDDVTGVGHLLCDDASRPARKRGVKPEW